MKNEQQSGHPCARCFMTIDPKKIWCKDCAEVMKLKASCEALRDENARLRAEIETLKAQTR